MDRAFFALAAAAALLASCADDDETAASGQGGATTNQSASSSAASTGATGGSGGEPPVCFDYMGFVPDPDVSFEDDVMPIFATSCNANTCHGNASSPDAELFLGTAGANDAATIDAVWNNLVDVNATRAPAMKRVAPGDPERSFLMIKLDDDTECPQVECGALGCGVKMPNGKPQLSESLRHGIRSWIANGAPRHAGSGGGGGGGAGGAGGGGGN